LDPVLGNENKFALRSIPQLKSLIEDLFQKRLNKYVYPNKRPLQIPLTKATRLADQPKVNQKMILELGEEEMGLLAKANQSSS